MGSGIPGKSGLEVPFTVKLLTDISVAVGPPVRSLNDPEPPPLQAIKSVIEKNPTGKIDKLILLNLNIIILDKVSRGFKSEVHHLIR
jgi:hypothetical protein